MATKVIMPKVDMDQETGTVVEWLKQNGDEVNKDEPILVIETEKVAINVESPATGILQGIRAKPEEVLPIGTIIAYILEPGEEMPDDEEFKVQSVPTFPLSKTTILAPLNAGATPVARKIATAHNIDLAKIEGTGLHGKVTKHDVLASLDTTSIGRDGGGKVFATPAARRAARIGGVDLAKIDGSGPGGRIQAADVMGGPAASPGETLISKMGVIPMQGMRRSIAERMTVSYQTTPHINFTISVNMDRFEEIRAQLNKKAEVTDQHRVSLTAQLVKAVAWTLKRNPFLNSSLREDGIHLLPDINLGVAVALPEGLIVPVVHNADQMGIGDIAREVNDLVTHARQGQLVANNLVGGTFTISNLGPFGIEHFTAIINPSQAAILAVGAIQHEVIVNEENQIVSLPKLRMTLCVDHRIVDGAVAAHFLTDLRESMESPELLLL